MSPVALSTILALAATSVSLVSAQGAMSTFPATPLASKHYAYPTGIVSILCNFVLWVLTVINAAV
jgi:hypothetical protein